MGIIMGDLVVNIKYRALSPGMEIQAYYLKKSQHARTCFVNALAKPTPHLHVAPCLPAAAAVLAPPHPPCRSARP
jgi:hypothetical protein